MKAGEPFSPWRGACGFYPPDVVGRQRRLTEARSSRTRILRHGEEPHTIGIEQLNILDKVSKRSPEAVNFPHHDCIEPFQASVGHQAAERGPACLGARDAMIDVLLDATVSSSGQWWTRGNRSRYS
jgi:hypothetical protein